MSKALSKRQLQIIKRRVYSANYRAAHQFDQEGILTTEDVLQMLEKRPLCLYCDRPLTPSTLSLDHVVALARGGKHHPDNIVLSCRRDNRYKRAIPAEDYLHFLNVLKDNRLTELFFRNYRPQSYRR